MSHLYITDLDGTLLDDATAVSPESAAIISDLSARGALITVATARTPATVEKLLCDTHIRIPAIVMTGASMWDRQKRRYVNPRLISPAKAAVAIDVFIRNGLQPFVYTIRGELLEVFHHGPLTPEEQTFVDLRKDLELKKFYLDSTERRVRDADNVILIFGMGHEPQLGEIARQLEAEGEYSVSFYEDNASPQYYIEVFAEGVSKASAVSRLAADVGADNITVYGDNLNDLSMMAVADDSVAVSNAKPEVLAQASRSIGSNNSDAVAKDMKEQFEKTAPAVSVLIITYNQRDTISRAIDSVIEQETDYPYEILIGDDGSTDGTRQICEEYAARYPNLIRLMPDAPNKGMLRNYFDTLDAARGRYIADCAGDDCWCDPHKIDVMTRILERNPDVTAVFSDARLVYESDPSRTVTTDTNPSVARWRNGRFKGHDILAATLNHTNALPYILSTGIYRRVSVEKIIRSEPLMVCNPEFGIEDIPVIAAAASEGDIVHIPVVTLDYYQSDETVSTSHNIEKMIRFYCRSLHCSHALGEFYGVGEERLADVHRTKSEFLVSCAFNSGSEEMHRLVVNTLKEWQLPLTLKTRLHLGLMRNRTLWNLTRKLKKKFILRNG